MTFKPTRTKHELLTSQGVVVTYYGELAIIFLEEDLAKLSADEYRIIRAKAACIYYRGVTHFIEEGITCADIVDCPLRLKTVRFPIKGSTMVGVGPKDSEDMRYSALLH